MSRALQRRPGTPVTTIQALPDGKAGVRATLAYMGRLVADARGDYRIRQKALDLVRGLPGKNWVREAKAISRFVRDRIRYVRDIDGMETIADPWNTLEIGQGDCDDKAVLAAALLQSIGHPVRFLAVGFDGEPISHVLVETLIGPMWVPMELTERIPFGDYPEGITDSMTGHIPR